MTSAEPLTRKRFPRLSSTAFEHPADRQALEALRRIPGLDKIVKKMIELGWERFMRIENLGSAVHVSPKQCPKIYKLFKEACEILDVPEPDLFLASNPFVNAYTFGCDRPFIVLQSGLVDLLDEKELQSVMGHELGHVKAGHVLYRSLALLILTVLYQVLPISPLVTMAMRVALMDWYRKSELTADRAELLVTQDLQVCLNVHMKLAAGSKTVFQQMDTQEFLRQADSYDDLDHSTLNKFYKLMKETQLTHPLPVYRSREIKNWSESKQFQEIMAGHYPTNDQEVTVRSCPHCGSKISPSFFFCPDCGKNSRV
ncbi:MAG: M48 family metallopeptidase [Candidatus Melainabacteria bacterium]|jgi:Zn-dependent protease with chaperone function|nr:M48 family metallopeptidase [Candidatus Melainabacteria bacterium]